jgi:hypothetical protein
MKIAEDWNFHMCRFGKMGNVYACLSVDLNWFAAVVRVGFALALAGSFFFGGERRTYLTYQHFIPLTISYHE